jgi:Ca-activated chloride channel family protein
VPLTDDPSIIQAFAPALAPELMPAQGDAAAAALRLAASMIARNSQPGSILLIADSVAPDQVQPDLPRTTILAPVAEGPELTALRTIADRLGASLVELTPDDADVRRLSGLVETSIVAATSEGGERWQDAGYWLVPLAALLTLLWFRPGWVARAG